jgi:hypothetical protein
MGWCQLVNKLLPGCSAKYKRHASDVPKSSQKSFDMSLLWTILSMNPFEKRYWNESMIRKGIFGFKPPMD